MGFANDEKQSMKDWTLEQLLELPLKDLSQAELEEFIQQLRLKRASAMSLRASMRGATQPEKKEVDISAYLGGDDDKSSTTSE